MNTYYLRTPTCTRQTSEVHVYLHSQGIEAVTTWKNAAGGQSRTGTWEHYMSSPANHQLCCLKKNNEIMIIFEEYMQVLPPFRFTISSHFQADVTTPRLKDYHERLQTFLLWFIDASSYIGRVLMNSPLLLFKGNLYY